MLHVCWLQIGQALSSRPDVLPPEYITELEVLQDRIPPFSNDEALQVCKCSRRAVSTALYLLNRQLQQMH
jgi:predicted unusual protein kinase regulating ubiquinone biosynthesis (AarF/ABC1/UbiB family)